MNNLMLLVFVLPYANNKNHKLQDIQNLTYIIPSCNTQCNNSQANLDKYRVLASAKEKLDNINLATKSPTETVQQKRNKRRLLQAYISTNTQHRQTQATLCRKPHNNMPQGNNKKWLTKPSFNPNKKMRQNPPSIKNTCNTTVQHSTPCQQTKQTPTQQFQSQSKLPTQQQSQPHTTSTGTTAYLTNTKPTKATTSRKRGTPIHIMPTTSKRTKTSNTTTTTPTTTTYAHTNAQAKLDNFKQHLRHPTSISSATETTPTTEPSLSKTLKKPTLPPKPRTIKNNSITLHQQLDIHNNINTNKCAYKIDQRNDFPKNTPVQEDIGKCGLMWPRGNIANQHPAATHLQEYSTNGCPVDAGKNWTKEDIVAALKRGPHISAKTPDAIQYLHQETNMKLQQGYLNKVQWKDIKQNIPPNLKLSPLALIPHKSRSYRCILDLSFQLKVNNKKINSVNISTQLRAPQKSMAQLGSVTNRLIHTMANNHNVKYPFYFSKCDVKDGFWRMIVNRKDAWNFCYVIPSLQKTCTLDETEIVVPHALQMGWSESPPYFCTATETGRDVIEYYFNNYYYIPPHNLEHHLIKEIQKQQQHPSPTVPISKFEVYVDDFIAYTNDAQLTNIQRMARALLHGIHSIFPPPGVSGHNGEEPISIKKLQELEGMFQNKKEVLGWMFNGKDFTIYLPDKKVQKILENLQHLLQKKLATLNELEKIQGQLIHASIGIPGGRGTLSPLYKAVASQKSHITINNNLKQCFKDWKHLIKMAATRPTSVLELVARDPHYIAYTDSSKSAVGGVWVSGTKDIPSTVWRFEWPQQIQNKLVSADNTAGSLSINDLELAGIIIAWLILERLQQSNLKHVHTGVFCDNDSTVNWITKKSTSTSTVAGHLLRALALRQHIHQAAPMQVVHIQGSRNTMADVASRSFCDTTFTNSNKTFLQTFSSMFPLQNTSWQEFHVPKRITSKVTSCLLGKPLTMELWTKTIGQDKNTGPIGATTPSSSAQTHTSPTSQAQNNVSSSRRLLQGSGQESTAKEVLYGFQQLQKRWRPYQRPLNWLENSPLSTKQKKYTNSQWHGSLRDTEEKTHLQHHNLQFQSRFQKCVGKVDTTPTMTS